MIINADFSFDLPTCRMHDGKDICAQKRTLIGIGQVADNAMYPHCHPIFFLVGMYSKPESLILDHKVYFRATLVMHQRTAIGLNAICNRQGT